MSQSGDGDIVRLRRCHRQILIHPCGGAQAVSPRRLHAYATIPLQVTPPQTCTTFARYMLAYGKGETATFAEVLC
jgi:hypothetical protein